ncbi:MAG: hypothetical protein FWD67_10235 [Betaproteobacteria bacterium]|nr:hypothetical protein [Betaproteobacteria bacterium]
MKYSLFAAALLAFVISACDSNKETPPPAPAEKVSAPAAEQAPAPVQEAPVPAAQPATDAAAPASAEPATPHAATN